MGIGTAAAATSLTAGEAADRRRFGLVLGAAAAAAADAVAAGGMKVAGAGRRSNRPRQSPGHHRPRERIPPREELNSYRTKPPATWKPTGRRRRMRRLRRAAAADPSMVPKKPLDPLPFASSCRRRRRGPSELLRWLLRLLTLLPKDLPLPVALVRFAIARSVQRKWANRSARRKSFRGRSKHTAPARRNNSTPPTRLASRR